MGKLKKNLTKMFYNDSKGFELSRNYIYVILAQFIIIIYIKIRYLLR